MQTTASFGAETENAISRFSWTSKTNIGFLKKLMDLTFPPHSYSLMDRLIVSTWLSNLKGSSTTSILVHELSCMVNLTCYFMKLDFSEGVMFEIRF